MNACAKSCGKDWASDEQVEELAGYMRDFLADVDEERGAAA